MENKIRDIDAKNSVFDPTIPGLLTEKKDRGLPATKDIRDNVHRIENTAWIPDSYDKIRQRSLKAGSERPTASEILARLAARTVARPFARAVSATPKD